MKNRQLILNMTSTMLAFCVNMGINFFLTPYITKNVGVEAYGFITLANNFVMYASLLTIALNSMMGRFITIEIHQGNYEKANKYFTSAVYANIFIGLILLLPSLIIVLFLNDILTIPANIILDVKLLFLFIFINFFLSIINASYSTSTFATNRLDLAAKINIVSYVMKGLLLLGLFMFFKPHVLYVGFAACVVSMYLLIKNIYYTRKLLPNIQIKKSFFDIKSILEVVKSGVWNTITKLGQILTDGLDLLITNLFINPLAMGQLAIVKTITTTLSTFVSTFAGVFSPQQTIDYAKGKMDEVVKDFKFSMKLTGLFASSAMCFLLVFGYSFYSLWVPNQDINLLTVVSFVSVISLVISSVIVPLWQIFTITNKLKVNALVHVFVGLFNTAVVFILLQFTDLGIIAVAGVSSMTAIVKNLIYTPLYSAHCLGVKKTIFYPEIVRYLIVSVVLTIIYFGFYSLIPVNSWAILILMVFVCGIVGVIVNYFLVFNKNDRMNFINIIKRKILRGKSNEKN